MDSKRLYSGTILLLNLFLVESTIYMANSNMSTMLEFTDRNQPCTAHKNWENVKNILSKIDATNIVEIPSQIYEELSKSCKNNRNTDSGGLIFPGTKWCGPGTIANGYNDLGTHSNEDSCCRDHDHCPNQLEPGQCRHGICNTSPYTGSHCDCDEVFKRCLRNVNSDTANAIGLIYFNVAQVTCFKERRSCPQSMRDNLSYSWFCEEWKFTPTAYYIPSLIERKNQTHDINEIPNEKRNKSQEPSKIDRDLETIFGKGDDITRIMNDF